MSLLPGLSNGFFSENAPKNDFLGPQAGIYSLIDVIQQFLTFLLLSLTNQISGHFWTSAILYELDIYHIIVQHTKYELIRWNNIKVRA